MLKYFLKVSIQKLWSRGAQGSIPCCSQIWAVSQLVLVLKAWRSHEEKARLGAMRSQKRPLAVAETLGLKGLWREAGVWDHVARSESPKTGRKPLVKVLIGKTLANTGDARAMR